MAYIEIEPRDKIGSIAVDAGIVWIGDPCYIDANDSPPFDDWKKFCKTIAGEAHHEFKEGVVVSTVHGDGRYGVYRVNGGIFIDFDSLIDDEH